MIVSHSGQAGLRYNPQVSSSLQRDIVSWLDMREQPELEANNIYIIPDRTYEKIEVGPPLSILCERRGFLKLSQ